MRTDRLTGLKLLLLGCVILVALSALLENISQDAMLDLKVIYYPARCLMLHRDPYNEAEVLRVLDAEAVHDQTDAALTRAAVKLYIYLPTAFAITIPLALLPWAIAHLLWMTLSLAVLFLAALAVWSIAADGHAVIAGGLLGFLLATSAWLIKVGNPAAMAAGLCVLSVWCFTRNRFAASGVICLAASLLLKPHDGGFVWLFFLLAGGMYRKRALQTLAVVMVLSVPGIVWTAQVSPNWRQELAANLKVADAPGGFSNPTPAAPGMHRGTRIIDLQTVFSVFNNDPDFYNIASFAVVGALILAWVITTLKSRVSPETTWPALAAIAALTLLPVYHRQYDAKLLMLAVPACAMLWKRRGALGWMALISCSAAIFVTGDIPFGILASLTSGMNAAGAGIWGKVVMVVLARPVPLILLLTGAFYLWVYVRTAFARGPSAAVQGE